MGSEIVVVVEHLQGQVAEVTLELLGKARALAGATGDAVVALLLGGGDLTGQLGGADKILQVGDPALNEFVPSLWTAAAAEVLKGRSPRAVLVGNTSMGMDLAPALASAMGAPLLSYCQELEPSGGSLVATCSLYGGKVNAEVEVSVTAVYTVQAGSFPADAGRSGGAAQVESASASAAAGGVRFKQLIAPEEADVDITRSDILVSIGRGIGDQANIELAEELAESLGAAVSASRPLIDSGWMPKSRQVGKSGLTVKPKCYLACGISGAPEHLEGMRDSALIIAINTDEGAPIFDVAHYGAVADMLDLLPALTDRLKSLAK